MNSDVLKAYFKTNGANIAPCAGLEGDFSNKP